MTPEQAAAHLSRNLVGSDRAALQVLLDELAWQTDLAAQHARLRTLGGPPPAVNDTSWRNRAVGAGVHPDYRGRL